MSIFSPKKGRNITIIYSYYYYYKSNVSPKSNLFQKFSSKCFAENSKNNNFWIKHVLTCYTMKFLFKKMYFFQFYIAKSIKK